ncbi:MAG: hypothetical protein D6770_09885 [Anaerolineae bacterium]|nr:MAG: hypothetical protein D6770_09885 [Anaerolineae bacterium]
MSTTLYCANHPNRETTLRCNRCEKPICAECAVHTPTGYRCKECVRSQQKIFITAQWYDYLIGPFIAIVLSLLASGLVFLLGAFIGFFMWFAIFALAPAAGALIANLAYAAVKRRRARTLFLAIAGGVVLGVMPVALFLLLSGDLYSLIWQGLYAALAASTVFYRLAGIQVR